MASNYNRKSASSGSRRPSRDGARRSARASETGVRGGRSMRGSSRSLDSQRSSRAGRGSQPMGQAGSGYAGSSRRGQDVHAIPGGMYDSSRYVGGHAGASRTRLESVSVGDLRQSERQDRNERSRRKARNYAIRVIAVLALIVVLVIAGGVVYNSDAFTIENVEVNGVEHLTSSDMSQLAAIPSGSTLLRIDTDTVKNRLLQNAWVQDVHVNRVFPNTLEINVTERTIKAVVSVPTSTGKSTKQWAISEDHMWLMPIPDKNSDAGKATSDQIYADADAALKIVDVPFGTEAAIGTYCTDANVLNALGIVSGMTTDLANQVVEVSAAGADETTILLDNGIEIAFGKAENIRDKERLILQIMAENPDSVSYINVRSVTSPTWRTV